MTAERSPEVLDYETWQARWSRRTGRLHLGNDHGRLAFPHGANGADQRRLTHALDREAENSAACYREWIGALLLGTVRLPTDRERTVRKARGHADNAAVQAARRLCAKKGWEWNDAE